MAATNFNITKRSLIIILVAIFTITAIIVAVVLTTSNSSSNPAYSANDYSDIISKSTNCITDTNVYHDSENIEKCMSFYSSKVCPNAVKQVKIGESEMGREIFGLVYHLIDDDDDENGSDPKDFINIGLFANMHGNEATGRELLNWFMSDLCNFAHEYENDLQRSWLKRIFTKRSVDLSDAEATSLSSTQTLSRHTNKNERYIFYEKLLKSSYLHIIPSINPDGFETRYLINRRDGPYSFSNSRDFVEGRYNLNGVDLNRNFPDLSELIYYDKDLSKPDRSRLYNDTFFEKFFVQNLMTQTNSNGNWVNYNSENENYSSGPSSDKLKINHSSQNNKILTSETRLTMNYLKNNIFDFMINFHDGAKVVSYPLDKYPLGGNEYAKSKDDILIKKLARSYADEHLNFFNSQNDPSCISGSFDNGITNGADWYSLGGGFQDYSYLRYGTIHLTVEANCHKFSDESKLPTLIEDNKPALLNFLDVATGEVVLVIGKSSTPNSEISFQLLNSGDDRTWIISNSDKDFRKGLSAKGNYRIFEGSAVRVDNIYLNFGVNKLVDF